MDDPYLGTKNGYSLYWAVQKVVSNKEDKNESPLS